MHKPKVPPRLLFNQPTLIVSLLLLFLATAWLLFPRSQAAHADEYTITLDGERDPAYVLIASDPSGDLASPGPADWSGTQWTDLTHLYVTADSTNLYVYADLPGYFSNLGDPGNDSSGQIGLAIDVDGAPNVGGAGDAWGNAISFAYNHVDGFATANTQLPDYLIRGDVSNDGGWTEFRTWNGNWDTGAGSNWGGISGGNIGTHIAYSLTQGVEFSIPLADIGSPKPAQVHLQFFATQGGGSKGAYDTLASDDQATGWDDGTTQTQFVSVPLAIDDSGDLASPGPGDWNGVAWTDATALHAWADATDLYLFIPSTAYSPTLSQGQIGLAIDTAPGGGSSDAWGNAITFAYTSIEQNLGQTPTAVAPILPDHLIRGNIFGATSGDNGWTEFRHWNGSNWDTGSGTDWGGIGNSGQPSLPGSHVAWSNGEGLRLTIPLADIAVSGGDTIHLEFFGTQSGGGKGAYDTVPSDDQSTGWDDPTTQTFLATYTIPDYGGGGGGGTCQGGAAQDNNIWWSDLGHNSRDLAYRTPGGPVTTSTTVTLRFRSACNDLTGAKVRAWNDRLNVSNLLTMTKVATDAQYDWWEVQLPVGNDLTVYWYRFIATDGTATAYYEDDDARTGGWGQTFGTSPDNSWQLSVYDPTYHTPDWAKNAVIYQIFADRFRDGDASNDPQTGRFFYNEAGGTLERSNDANGNWNAVVCDPRNATGSCPGGYSQNFYGGDLQGIIDELDYLQDLGVNTLYLNPIFESPSNHKYDTADYSQISADFGDLQTFIDLTTEAHNRGMHVVLDGVFNHTSSDSTYFDRYFRYDANGVLTSPGGIGTNDGSGACESQNSDFRDWYYFTDVPAPTGTCVSSSGTANGANYTSWFGFDSLPKLQANSQAVRDLIWDGGNWQTGEDGIARYWMQYADGWRLDVGGDVDPGVINDPSNDYWEGFRTAVRATNPETYIVIEEWGNASSWLLGQEMDATMNYQYGSAMLSFWRDTEFVDNDHNPGSSAGPLTPLSPSQLDERLKNWQERYPPEAYYAMMNLLDSHDTNRALFMLDHNAANGTDPTPLLDPNYNWFDAIERLKGVVLLQMTLPGAPTIYYGDEVGLVGPVYYYNGKWEDDPYNRQPFPWLDESGTPFYTRLQDQAGQDYLRDYYKLLIGARNAHPALRTGSFDTLLVDDAHSVYAYGRLAADNSDAAVVILNRAGTTHAPMAQDVALNVAGYLPAGAVFDEVLSGDTYTVTTSGWLTVTVPDQSGAVLVLASALPEPPAPVTDLAVTDVRSEEVDLGWTAVISATSYDVYRSLVSGGGYVMIGNTAATTYTDSNLMNATTYCYVVVSRDDNTGLTGGNSNEVCATPHHDLGNAWYALTTPAEISHTISAITPTVDIFGELYIANATGSNGPATGIWADLGYAPTGTLPISGTGWAWVTMVYSAANGNNDLYVGNLLPQAVGDYQYATRWSSDGGQTWHYAALGGPGYDPANAGVLHVLASSDTTAPSDPMDLTLDGTTPSSILMHWTPVTPTYDLAGYEIYREVSGTLHTPTAYTLLDTVDANTTNYTDFDVVTGGTYRYCVGAFDTSFNRSGCSNIIEATAVARMVDVTFNVTVPAYTPGVVHIVGSIPEVGTWDPGAVAMTKVNDSLWTITLSILDGTQFEYKFARGAWEMVEKQADGNTEVDNRPLTADFGTDGTQEVNVTVENWRDPIVVDYGPVDGSVNVTNTTTITATWNQAVPSDTTFAVTGPNGPVSGTFGYEAATFTTVFTPSAPLADGVYTVLVTGVSDVNSDVQQVPATWGFSTSAFFPRYSLYLPIVAHP